MEENKRTQKPKADVFTCWAARTPQHGFRLSCGVPLNHQRLQRVPSNKWPPKGALQKIGRAQLAARESTNLRAHKKQKTHAEPQEGLGLQLAPARLLCRRKLAQRAARQQLLTSARVGAWGYRVDQYSWPRVIFPT